MSRLARRISETGLYHIIFLGINKQNIFNEDADYDKLKEILRRVKNEMEYELYAYCLMSNHVHLFLKEKNPGDISKIMSKILSHYATWFNKKYDRSGALFSNRYKSEPVEDDRYLVALMRYIHQNPVKAGMVKSANSYQHSSYNEYALEREDLVNIAFILEILGSDRKMALSQFEEINQNIEKEEFEISNSGKSNAAVRRIIMSFSGGIEPSELQYADKTLVSDIIRTLVLKKGISQAAIVRVTGISRYRVAGMCKYTERKLPRPQSEKKQEADVQQNLPAYLM